MKKRMKIKAALFLIVFYGSGVVAGCGDEPQGREDTVIWENEVQFQAETDLHTDAARIASIYRETCGIGGTDKSAQAAAENEKDLIKKIIDRLGENGYTAVDSKNQVDMTNTAQVLAFCNAVDTKENAELMIIEVVNEDEAGMGATACRFRLYHFQTQNGRVDVARTYYCFDGDRDLMGGDTIRYPADVWQYTQDGYLVIGGSYYTDDYYIISLTEEPERAAFRVAPLDTKCRELCRKYIQPVGYEDNNLFLVDWTEEGFENLDFYDLFDRFYPMAHQKPVPYKASENPGIGMVYRIAEQEFEGVVETYLNTDRETLRSRTNYLPAERTYEYRPRGFYEIGCSNMPYPEVVDYHENSGDTITLTVNAVFPYECTSRAFSHEVVIRLLEDGGFQYVSNRIMDGTCDAWWHTGRLTDEEWETVYAWQDPGQDAAAPEDALWYLPEAEDCLLTGLEKEELKKEVLEAAGQVGGVYQDMEVGNGTSYASAIRNFSSAQCREVVTLLGRAGFVSVADDVNMENYQEMEAFYEAYKKGQEAMVTVYEVKNDGLIGAVTFIYRKKGSKNVLQTCYMGVDWQERGVPMIKNTLVSDVTEMNLTEKGYLIYTYKDQIVHSDACQYLRVRPLSDKCRELTRKYVAGLSFVNYNAFVTDWDSSNVEEILMPCMFEDIYRIDTGGKLEHSG